METLKLGSRGDSVKTLQAALGLLVDGIFGPLTEESVKDFQKDRGLAADGVVGGKTWAALGTPGDAVVKKSSRKIKEIIVHCTDTPEGRDCTVAQIRQMHLARGFSDVGYHYVIYRDGTVHAGRDVNISGAHCKGHNSVSVGVCYVGGREAHSTKPKDTRTPAQKKSLVELLTRLKRLYPQAAIHSHRDFANKACPSFDATKEYAGIR